MKIVLRATLALALIGLAWAVLTYPRVGSLALHHGARLEAGLYGLRVQPIELPEITLTSFQGGPEGAPAIVMLHGYTASKDVWIRFARHFVDDYRVIIPDQAGHGESPYDPNADYSATAQAERVAQMLDALGIEQAHIIGNSMGGLITATFAINYPQRTRSAGLVDPAGVISPHPSDFDQMLARGENPFLMESVEDFNRFYPMTMAQPPLLPGFVLDAVAAEYVARKERYAKIHADFRAEVPITDRLDGLQAPALLIWGREDRLLHVSATTVWMEAVPRLQVEVMEGLGHMPMVEAPTASAALYRAFLSQL